MNTQRSTTDDQETPLRILLNARNRIDSMLATKLSGPNIESEFVLALNRFCNEWIDKNQATKDFPLTFGD